MEHLPIIESICIWGVIFLLLGLGVCQIVFIVKRKYRRRIISVCILFLCIIVLKIFFIEVNRVTGISMEPTLLDGDYVLVMKWKYGPRLPRSCNEVPWLNFVFSYFSSESNYGKYKNVNQPYKRIASGGQVNYGDIVVFNLPPYQEYRAVKRCVGLPGDYIIYNGGEIVKKRSQGIISDTCILLPYSDMSISLKKSPIFYHYTCRFYNLQIRDSISKFKHNYYYVAGDNRTISKDSRTWGLLQEDHIIGKVSWVLFSISKKGKIRWERFMKKVW